MEIRDNKSLQENLKPFRKALRAWFEHEGRKLPWRQEPSLYKTVVSEFMLQQTQVETVLPYFERWMRRFPDFAALARARESTTVKFWEGLGYYSRARNLHKLAGILTNAGNSPNTAHGWAELPGVGPYTSHAIASLRFNQPVACVDGNVIRVIARLTANKEEFKDTAAACRGLQECAALLLDEASPGSHNEAMMELGATVCSRIAPKCGQCPVGEFCAAKKAGNASRYPRFKPRGFTRSSVNRAFSEHGDAILLQRNSRASRRLGGQWELPVMESLRVPRTEDQLIVKRSRTIGRERIEESIYRVFPTPELMIRVDKACDLRWATKPDLKKLTLSGPHRRWVKEISNLQRGSADPNRP
jgi:A/G-specific adenine glycosylase